MLFSNDDIGNAYLARLREILDWKEIFNSLWKREENTFIQFLLDAGLDVNALSKFGTTMLSYAAECGNMEIVEFLTQKGADGTVKNIDGSTPLHVAAKHGHNEMVKFFLSSIELVDVRDDSGNTPLHYVANVKETVTATRESYYEIVHCLLNGNADLDAINEDGDTPLLLAARNIHKDLVELLFGLGANVLFKGKYDTTLLHYCCELGWAGLVQSLVEGGFNIDLNAKDLRFRKNWYTPLTMAACNGHEDVVKLLIEHGADIKLEASKGRTLLHFVCQSNLLDTVKYLVRAGCDVNAQCSGGRTPLIWAVDDCDNSVSCEVVEYLIDNGADINCLDKEGASVLHYACENGSLNVVKVLTKNKCDLNIQEGLSQNTPLRVAAKFRHLKVVKHLLEVGADFNIQNYKGKSAFHSLLKSPICLEGITLFLESGAFLQAKDYIAISENPFLKEDILKDLKLCTQAIMNKLNADLLKIYEIPAFSKDLPPLKQLKLVNDTNAARSIQQSVSYEIQSKGYCNVMKVRPINLAILSLGSLIEYYYR